MDDKEVTAGLTLLADEAETPPIDVYAVMAKARVRTRNRRLGMASALGTLAVAGAMVVTMSFGGAGHSPATGGQPPTSTAQTDTDAQAAKLTQQLADAKVIPEQFTVVPYDNSETPGGTTTPPPPSLTFAYGPIPPSNDGAYLAHAGLSDGQLQMNLQILVTKRAAGTPLEHLPGTPLPPCAEGEEGCTRTTLDDGTLAAVLINQRPPAITLISAITVQRPDGTYVQVIVSTKDGDTPLPWTGEQLLKFATAFTY